MKLSYLLSAFSLSKVTASSTIKVGSSSKNKHDSSGRRRAGVRGLAPVVGGEETFPPYSQQCQDDAGPPFMDDAETFGPGGTFHDQKPATAVGDCPAPLQGACGKKEQTAAFLEGPIDCGGRGWFCRILEEPGWPTINLISDVNFGYCNTTEGFEDAGFDKAGHCHGSNSDDSYYWWVRDHWHRQYVRFMSYEILYMY